jgi:hypothetical protein
MVAFLACITGYGSCNFKEGIKHISKLKFTDVIRRLAVRFQITTRSSAAILACHS